MYTEINTHPLKIVAMELESLDDDEMKDICNNCHEKVGKGPSLFAFQVHTFRWIGPERDFYHPKCYLCTNSWLVCHHPQTTLELEGLDGYDLLTKDEKTDLIQLLWP